MSPSDVGFRLKKIREKLGLTQEAIQEASLEVARREGNSQFAIRHSHLSVIENSNSVPNIFKLFSLCAIYRLDMNEVLRWYGISTEKLSSLQSVVKVEKTHLMNLNVEIVREGKTLVVPARLDPSFDALQTNFLTRLVQAWKEVPIGLLTQLDLRNHAYGLI